MPMGPHVCPIEGSCNKKKRSAFVKESDITSVTGHTTILWTVTVFFLEGKHHADLVFIFEGSIE